MAEELKIVVTADTRQATAGMKRMTTSAKVAMAAIGAAAIVIGTKAVKAATSFGRAMAEVSTITDLNEKQTERLAETVKQMSVVMGVDAKESARGLYQTISAGVTDSTEAMELLAVATRLSIAGLTDQETVVDVMTTVMNAYGMSVKDANDISDTLFTTVRLGKLRLEDLAGSLGTVIPIAAASGIEFEEIAAAMAALTKGGLSAERSSTALRASLTAILQPSMKMQAAAKSAGFEIGMQALKGKGLTGVLAALSKLEETDAEATLKLFENKRALVGMLSLASDGAREFSVAMEGMESKVGATNTAFEKMNKSAARQFDIFSAKLNVTMIELGNAILPSVISGMEALGPAIEDVGQTIKDNEDNLTDFAEGLGFVATAATGLLGILTDVGGKIGEVGGKAVFSLLRTGLTREVGQRLGRPVSLGAAITPEEIAAAREIRGTTINMGPTYVQTKDPRDRLEDGAFSQRVAS